MLKKGLILNKEMSQFGPFFYFFPKALDVFGKNMFILKTCRFNLCAVQDTLIQLLLIFL